MKKNILVAIIIALFGIQLFATTWYVDDNGSLTGAGTYLDPFLKIQQGVNAASDGDVVMVMIGTYNVTQTIQFGDKAITMKSQAPGSPQYTVINSQTDLLFNLLNVSNELVIEGIKFVTSGKVGITNKGITFRNNIVTASFDALTIQYTSEIPLIESNSFTGCIRRPIYVLYANADIMKNSFYANDCFNVGAIFIEYGRNVNIIENEFNDNSAQMLSSAISIESNYSGISSFNICNNLFESNHSYNLITPYATDIFITNVSSGVLEIENNVFKLGSSVFGDGTNSINFTTCSNLDVNIKNNTFANYTDIDFLIGEFGNNFMNADFINNIFVNNVYTGPYLINIDDCDVDYSFYNGNYDYYGSPVTLTNGTAGTHNWNINPQLDSNYTPIWNSTTKSPCIDAGYSATGETDTDGTPIDIGAVPACTHYYDNRELPDINTDSGIEWLCFPVVDDVKLNEDLLQNVVNPNLNDIDNILCFGDFTFEQNSPNIWYPQTIEVKQEDGYILQVNSNVYTSPELSISGFTVPNNHSFTIKGNSYENWLGYFPDEPTDWDEAFGDDLAKIYQIKHQDWCYTRGIPGGFWSMTTGDGIIYPGEMVKVKLYRGESDLTNFSWTVTGNGGGIFPKVTSFSFTETSDYTPVYVDLEADREVQPLEVAIIIDDVCKGAGVVADNQVMVPLYLTGDENLEDCVVEFEVYYGERESNKKIDNYTVNEDDHNYYGQLNLAKMSDYYSLRMGKAENNSNSPAPKLTTSNYPNPFNPTTTISFNLPEAGDVKIDIFNAKGQLVKTLSNSNFSAGHNSVIWHGKDENNDKVGSGVYFYRISTATEVAQEKILLLK